MLGVSIHSGYAQIFDGQQYPPSVSWRQINTPNFQLIFPAAFESEAQKLAGSLQDMQHRVSETYNKEPRKISIILQNQTVESNGFVQLAPRRSEFFTTPPQRNDFQDWLNQLAIHELRHVVQIDKLTGYLRAPFFEQLAFAIYGVTLPAWFFEGDAVVTETIWSPSGRGRLPSWEMPLRTNLLSGATFGYQKNYLGSLKDITSGYYELGYFMVAKMERDFGSGILDSLMSRMVRNPIRPYNFSNSLRKFTGYNTRQWYQETMKELTQKWQEQRAAVQPLDYPILRVRESGKPEHWLLPRTLPDGRIIALNQGVQHVPAIVILNKQGEQEQVIKTGRQTEPNFSYAAGKVTWDEVRRHSRYGKRTYNVINVYELKTRSYRQLARRSRLFSPALHPDGSKIAAVEIGLDNRVCLVLLRTDNGKEIGKFSAPDNMMLQTPAFDSTGTKIIAVGVTRLGAALVEFNLATQAFSRLTDWQSQQIERPSYADHLIIFKAHYNGIDNIYAFDRTDQSITQLTNTEFGAFNPSFDETTNQLWFNNYRPDGYRISWLPKATWGLQDTKKIANSHISYFKPLINHEINLNAVGPIQNKIFPTTPYNEVKNLVNFHSLSVDNGNFESFDAINPGLYWLSDNLLNTAQIRLGYAYDGDIRSSEYLTSVAYQRYFPRFSLEYRNRGQVGTSRVTTSGENQVIGLRWREHVSTLRMDIPLVFYRLNQVYTTGLSVATSYTSRYGLSEPRLRNRFIDRIRFPMDYQFYFNRNVRQSALDLAPRWGQQLSVTYRHFPFRGQVSGELLSLRTAFYFPGLWPNHSLLARFNYQQRNGTYQMANEIPLVSGYDQLQPVPVNNTLLFSYRFPIAYPDWAIGPLAFIKRFKGGLFADFQNVRRGNPFQPRTFGLELRSDVNFLRFYLPNFDLGIKLIYANDADPRRKVFATYSIGYSY